MLSLVRQCGSAALRPRRILSESRVLSRGLASPSASKWVLTNDRISARVVSIVDDEGNRREDVPLRQAIQEAQSQGVDLVQVSPEGRLPAICRLFDAKKRLYELKKATKKATMEQKPKCDKEVVVGVKIAPNDLNFKVEQLRKFLSKGHKVKVTIKFKQAYHLKTQSLEQLQRIEELIGADVGAPSGKPREQFGGVYVYYSPAN